MAERIRILPPQSFSVTEARARFPGISLMEAMEKMTQERVAALETAGEVRFRTPVEATRPVRKPTRRIPC